MRERSQTREKKNMEQEQRERKALSVMNTPFKSWNYHLKLECLGLWSPALSALLRTGFS